MSTRAGIAFVLLIALGSMGQQCSPAIEIVTANPDNVFSSPQTVTVEAQGYLLAEEADWDLQVRYVEFFRDGNLVCRDFTVPYTCDWSITSEDDGSYPWLAEAILDNGTTAFSQPTDLIVAIGAAPTEESGLVGFVPDVGTARDVVVDPVADLAYVASDNFGVAVVDVSNPAEPVAIGGTVPPFEAHRLDVEGGLAVAASPAGLSFVDVTDPSLPRRVSHVEGNFPAVALSGSTVFARKLVPGNPGHVDLLVFDASVPSSPVLRADVYMTGSGDVAVHAGALYVGDGSNLSVFDVANPFAPRLVRTLQLGHAIQGLRVVGSRLYVAGQSVSILGIGSALNPSRLGTIPTGATDVDASGNWLYAAYGSVLKTIDVGNPSNPGPVRTSLAQGIGRLDVAGGFAFTTSVGVNAVLDTGGLYVSDLSNPSSPVTIAQVLNIATNRAMAAAGSVAVAAGPDGLCVVDLSAPTLPVLEAILTGNFSAVALVGGRWAYARELVPGNPARFELVVVDLADLAQPVVTRRIPLSSGGPILVRGSWAYVGDGSRLRVYDARAAASPVQVSTRSLAHGTSALAASAGLLFAGGSNGVSILGLANPANPTIHSTLALNAKDLAADASQLVVVDGGGLTVVDAADPRRPVIRGSLAGLSTQGVALEGGRAWVPTLLGHVAVVDLSNPASPRVTRTIDVPGIGGDAAVSGGLVLAGDAAAVVDVIAP